MILFGKGVFADVIILRVLNIRYINRYYPELSGWAPNSITSVL